MSEQGPLLELPAIPSESVRVRITRYIKSRWRSMTALAAVAAGIIAVGGHFLGGIAGLWEFYRLVSGKHAPAVHSQPVDPAQSAQRPFRSLAVMPLTADPATPDNEEFAQRVTRDLTLSTGRHLTNGVVLSNGLVQQFRGGNTDPRKIGAELNVRYLMSGRLVRNDDKRELTVELVDSTDGVQLWTEKQIIGEKDSADALARISNAVGAVLQDTTRKEVRSLPEKQRRAWELVLRSEDMEYSMATLAEKQRLIEEALRFNPEMTEALMSLAGILSVRARSEPENRKQLVELMDQVTAKLVRLAPRSVDTWLLRSDVLRRQGNWDGAFAASDEALRIDPFHVDGIVGRSYLLILAGRASEALPLIDRAFELRPGHGQAIVNECLAYVQLSRYQEAVPICERAAPVWDFWILHYVLAAVHMNAGNPERAAYWAQRAKKANPRISIKVIRNMGGTDNAQYWAQRAPFLDALRKLGIPED